MKTPQYDFTCNQQCLCFIIELCFGNHNILKVVLIRKYSKHYPLQAIPPLELTGNGDQFDQLTNISFPEKVSIRGSADTFIIFGEPAEEGEIPYQAYLISSQNNSNRGALCGGSLIKPKWILTAAHCVENTDKTIVQMGSVDKKTMTYREISYFRVVHVLYNSLTLYNDIALVRLPVEPMSENIATIPIAPKNFSDLAGEYVLTSGFGLTSNKGDTSETLNKVELIAVTHKECRKAYGALFVMKSTLCAKYSTKKGQSTCSGDSGGPLVYVNETTKFLVGVTSFVSGKGCDSGELAGFTRVSSQHDWIETNTKKYETSNY